MPESRLATATNDVALCRETIAVHSRSFALAGRLLGSELRDAAAIVYTFCRRADDAIDLAQPHEQPAALACLRQEVAAVYADQPQHDPGLRQFQRVVFATGIPRVYIDELLSGMEMDARGSRYESLQDLLHYAFRVAGTVGLTMCHVMGVSDPRARKHAAHLGIAMQLTNICRDVVEDWERGRVYLPRELLQAHGSGLSLGGELAPEAERAPLACVIARLLDEADVYYVSAELGLSSLSFRAAWAVATASSVYRAIGTRLRRRRCDAFAGRAVVSGWRKLFLALGAGVRTGWHAWLRTGRFERAAIDNVLEFPNDVIPV